MEQITYYHDETKVSPPCHRVEIALLEAGASYTAHGFDIYNKPVWFAQANPLTGKVPVISYGGPKVRPEEPSPLSAKITESTVILEFLADLFPQSTLLPPVSDPAARARVRFLIDVIKYDIETPMLSIPKGIDPGTREKMIQGLEKFQALLPDSHDGGEYAIGKQFTNADCAIAPLLAIFKIIVKTNLSSASSEEIKLLVEALSGPKFERLRQYEKALWERESIKTVLDLDRLETAKGSNDTTMTEEGN